MVPSACKDHTLTSTPLKSELWPMDHTYVQIDDIISLLMMMHQR